MGYPGIAHWFFEQWKEEQTHAERLIKHLADRMSKVFLDEIGGVKQDWNSPLEMFQEALVHERKITKAINQLVDIAIDEKDYACVSCLKWFVDEQVEEEKNVADILTVMERICDNPDAMLNLDRELGERKK